MDAAIETHDYNHNLLSMATKIGIKINTELPFWSYPSAPNNLTQVINLQNLEQNQQQHILYIFYKNFKFPSVMYDSIVQASILHINRAPITYSIYAINA